MNEIQPYPRLKDMRLGKGRLVRPQTERYGDRLPIDDMQIRDAVCLDHGVQRAVFVRGKWRVCCCGKTVEERERGEA